MIKLIGTTHLMKKEEIENIIKKEKPDVIGVEFCQTRLNTMVLNQEAKEKNDTLIGNISKEIKKKAEEEGLVYGSDMIAASQYALKNEIPLSLLDRDIIEISNAMNKIPQEEQLGFMKELQEFQKKTLKEQTENIDENKVIDELKSKYPIAYEILIVSRDLFITYRIQRLMIKFPKKKILCFIGKGHLNKIKEYLEI